MATKDLEPGMLAAPNVMLEKKLAEGGMGSVWVAEHLTLKTRVAVKFMLAGLADTAEVIERFEREARAVATIKSPHIVQVLDHGVNQDGHPFIVMELLEGEDLGHRIDRDKKLSLPLVSQIVTQTAKALGKAHQLGIVHRDLKPENLFLTDVEGDLFVKVLDFGIAKRTEEKSKRMTATGSMLGTPIFMSPEQMTNAKSVGPASDQWALGVVVYYALTGELPFDGETMAALAIAVDRGVYVPLTERAPSLPSAIDAWVKQALAKNPEDRFVNVKEMAERLARIAEGAPDAPAPSVDGPRSSVRASSAPGRSDTRTIRGTSSESKSAGSSRIVGLLVLAAGLVAVAVLGFSYVKSPAPEVAAPSTKASNEPKLTPARPKATGPLVEPAPTEPPRASATASSAPTPSSAPSASASASPAPSATAHPGPHGPRPTVNTGEIPTTF